MTEAHAYLILCLDCSFIMRWSLRQSAADSVVAMGRNHSMAYNHEVVVVRAELVARLVSVEGALGHSHEWPPRIPE